MKRLLPLILLISLLAGCAQKQNTQGTGNLILIDRFPEQVVTGEMNSTMLKYGMNTDQLFEKKKECASYKTEMENDAKQYCGENISG